MYRRYGRKHDVSMHEYWMARRHGSKHGMGAAQLCRIPSCFDTKVRKHHVSVCTSSCAWTKAAMLAVQ
jgi:hypothetical protein